MTYIPNGKNIVYKESGTNTYGSPFYCLGAGGDHTGEYNEFVYTDERYWYMMMYGGVQKIGVTDYMTQSNLFNDVERYQGVLYDFYATAENPIATINLYRMMVGFKLIINDFTEGEITLSTMGGYSYSISAQEDSTTATLEQIVELPSMPVVDMVNTHFIGWTQEHIESQQPFPDEQSFPLYIKYTNSEGNELSLYSNLTFVYQRLKTHVLEFSLPEIINSGIQSNIKDEINGELDETEWQ